MDGSAGHVADGELDAHVPLPADTRAGALPQKAEQFFHGELEGGGGVGLGARVVWE